MRVLFLAHRIPFPPNKGEKIRAFYELKALKAAGHLVDVFAISEGPQDEEFAAGLSAHCNEVFIAPVSRVDKATGAIKSLAFGRPLSLPFFFSPRLKALIDTSIEKAAYDVIFVYSVVMMQYVPTDSDIPLILDLVDADSSKWKQYGITSSFPKSWIYRREAKLLNSFERESVKRSRQSFFVSEKEIRAAGCQDLGNVSAAENGVEIPSISPSDSSPIKTPYVVFVGQMNYPVNVVAVNWFAKEVFPLIRRDRPDATFAIVGRAPSPEVLELKKIAGVEVTGEVPEVARFIAHSSAVVAPFQISQGIHNKMLEGLAAGVPIVSTPAPVEPIRQELRSPILVGETATEFASLVLRILGNQSYSRIAKENVAAVRKYQSWDSTLRPMIDALASIECGAAVPVKR